MKTVFVALAFALGLVSHADAALFTTKVTGSITDTKASGTMYDTGISSGWDGRGIFGPVNGNLHGSNFVLETSFEFKEKDVYSGQASGYTLMNASLTIDGKAFAKSFVYPWVGNSKAFLDNGLSSGQREADNFIQYLTGYDEQGRMLLVEYQLHSLTPFVGSTTSFTAGMGLDRPVLKDDSYVSFSFQERNGSPSTWMKSYAITSFEINGGAVLPPPSAIPEPAPLALLLAGSLAVLVGRRKRVAG